MAQQGGPMNDGSITHEAAPNESLVPPRRHRWLSACLVVVVAVIGYFQVDWYQQPTLVRELSLPGRDIFGLQFSPDGKHLAAVSADHADWFLKEQLDVYDTEKLTVVKTFEGSNINCAWNVDGTILAVPRREIPRKQPDIIELWDTRQWKLMQTISIKLVPLHAHLILAHMEFDRLANLFIAPKFMHYDRESDDPYYAATRSGQVWWDSAKSGTAQLQSIGQQEQQDANTISAGGTSDWTRVAISYEDSDQSGAGSTIVWRVEMSPDGSRSIREEYQFGGTRDAVSKLTPDGSHLSIYQPSRGRFELRRLDGGEAYTVVSVRDRPNSFPEFLSRLAHSADSRLVAYQSLSHGVEVYRVSDGRRVMRVRDASKFALSPGGEQIAAFHSKSRRLCFYKIPE